jgi:septal ring factor EnvC (AmiA/AmiB activator)
MSTTIPSVESNEKVRKTVPTLENGRRSKYLVLFGEEAIRREKRRERNREAARKLKEKRQLIEDELNQKIKDLENQHSSLEKYLRFLQKRKKLLEDTINDLLMDSIDKYLSNEQYSFDPFDESIESILKSVFI